MLCDQRFSDVLTNTCLLLWEFPIWSGTGSWLASVLPWLCPSRTASPRGLWCQGLSQKRGCAGGAGEELWCSHPLLGTFSLLAWMERHCISHGAICTGCALCQAMARSDLSSRCPVLVKLIIVWCEMVWRCCQGNGTEVAVPAYTCRNLPP